MTRADRRGLLFFAEGSLQPCLSRQSNMEPIYVKETLINVSSMVSISAPIVIILWPDSWKQTLGLVSILLAVTLAYPPFGSPWRPHRHSDFANNRGGL